MHFKKQRLTTWAMAAAVAVAFLATPAFAADKDDHAEVYSRVELWQVDRAQWGAFVDMFEKYDKKIMEKLFADGLIVEWGMDADLLHEPDGYTHATYYSAMSMGGLAKAMNAYMEAWKEMAGDQVDALDAEFAGMITKHRDLMLVSDQWSKDAAFENGYWHSQSVKIVRTSDKDFHSYWNNRSKPVFEKLLANGDIVAFGLSTEEIVTHEPGWHTSWYVTATADGIDAVDAAFDADWGAMDEEGRRARWSSVMETVSEGSYRSNMSEVRFYAVKAH